MVYTMVNHMVFTAIVIRRMFMHEGNTYTGNAILQKIRVTSLTGHETRIMLSIYTVLLRGSVVFYTFVYSVTMGANVQAYVTLWGQKQRYKVE